MGLLDLPEYVLVDRLLVAVPALGLARLLLTAAAFGAEQAQYGGRSMVEEAARLARRQRHDRSRVQFNEGTSLRGWVRVLWELERLAAPLAVSKSHEHIRGSVSVPRQEVTATFVAGADAPGGYRTAMCGRPMGHGLHYAEFEPSATCSKCIIGLARSTFEPRGFTYAGVATETRDGWGLCTRGEDSNDTEVLPTELWHMGTPWEWDGSELLTARHVLGVSRQESPHAARIGLLLDLSTGTLTAYSGANGQYLGQLCNVLEQTSTQVLGLGLEQMMKFCWMVELANPGDQVTVRNIPPGKPLEARWREQREAWQSWMTAEAAVGRVHLDRFSLSNSDDGRGSTAAASEQYWDNERGEFVNLSDMSNSDEDDDSSIDGDGGNSDGGSGSDADGLGDFIDDSLSPSSAAVASAAGASGSEQEGEESDDSSLDLDVSTGDVDPLAPAEEGDEEEETRARTQPLQRPDGSSDSDGGSNASAADGGGGGGSAKGGGAKGGKRRRVVQSSSSSSSSDEEPNHQQQSDGEGSQCPLCGKDTFDTCACDWSSGRPTRPRRRRDIGDSSSDSSDEPGDHRSARARARVQDMGTSPEQSSASPEVVRRQSSSDEEAGDGYYHSSGRGGGGGNEFVDSGGDSDDFVSSPERQ